MPAANAGDALLVAFASQTGTAERIAWQTAADLRAAGLPVAVRSLGALHPLQLAAAKHALFITSTFGDGEAPDTARGFARRMRNATLDLSRLRHAVLTLGDRSYDEFCEFGRQLDQWLHHHGARPLFDRIVKDLSADAVDEYVKQLEHEVWKYSVKDPNWGKVARRLYNIFRLSSHYPEAAYIRELFDEPTTALYQVAALIRTLDEAAEEGSPFDREVMVEQADKLIMSAISALEGPEEAEVVAQLLRFRDVLSGRTQGDRSVEVNALHSETMTTVNEYFKRRLYAVPGIASYLDEIALKGEAH